MKYTVITYIKFINSKLETQYFKFASNDTAKAKAKTLKKAEKRCIELGATYDIYMEMTTLENGEYLDGDIGYFSIKDGKLVSDEL